MKPLLISSAAMLVVGLLAGPAGGSSIEPVPFKVPAKLPDAAEVLSPAAIQLDGFLGRRVAANERNRLLRVDDLPLLAGFKQKPGVHPWIGEHVGKWMHAATLAWVYTGDAELRAKLDRVAAELIAAQEADGYLGTYVPEKRFGLYPGADWDVWSHKYNLVGLLTYYQYTGNDQALNACRRIGDLLISTFGPGKKSVLSAGTHVGMAATSVLEPTVLLFRFTGDERYLAFARYLVEAWDEPQGPKIIAALLAVKQVNRTANGKAYEMLSNLVGLCELARATGERRLLDPVLNAWQDITAKRLYLTGSASQGEHFRDDYDLPNPSSANVAETCVTTTWIQLNLQLLRLTGEARFGAELERTFYNHLAAAQRPDGAQWCYFTALEGTKPYGPGINCCVSSGPRGMALVPQAAYLLFPSRADQPASLAVNLFEAGRVAFPLGGQRVTLEQRTRFPRETSATLVIHADPPAVFGLRIRQPAWTAAGGTTPPLHVRVGAMEFQADAVSAGWVVIPPRSWKEGDTVNLTFPLSLEPMLGTHGNAGKAAFQYGPLVLAYDDKRNPGLESPALLGFVRPTGTPALALKSESAEWLEFVANIRSARHPEPRTAVLVPFADAGRDGGRYAVWLRAPGAEFPKNESLLAFAAESRSREGNQTGSIADGDPASFVMTFDGQPQAEAWFAVALDHPVTISRVVFAHGQGFHDGGWFDASAGKPRIQVQRIAAGPWEDVGELSDYPATTALIDAGLQAGQAYRQRLQSAVSVRAVRVIGRPASGDNPRQAFASCAELQAFAE